jgi:hypothetical protein
MHGASSTYPHGAPAPGSLAWRIFGPETKTPRPLKPPPCHLKGGTEIFSIFRPVGNRRPTLWDPGPKILIQVFGAGPFGCVPGLELSVRINGGILKVKLRAAATEQIINPWSLDIHLLIVK